MIQELLARIDTLERENTRLKEEIEQLKKRLSKNSRNSSKPPSSDGLSRPNKNNSVSEQGKLKSKGTKKPSGGQKGHNGSNLGQAKPDEVITKPVTSCDHCQSDLSDTKAQGYVRRQLHDLPGMPKLKVSATCVRVPVITTHSLTVHATFSKVVTRKAAQNALKKAEGVLLYDNPEKKEFPTPADVVGTDPTWVGRVRQSLDNPKAIDLFVCGDNLRKGAALNTAQIAELVAAEFTR